MEVWKYINETAEFLPENFLINTETNIFKHGIMHTNECAKIVSLNLVNNTI